MSLLGEELIVTLETQPGEVFTGKALVSAITLDSGKYGGLQGWILELRGTGAPIWQDRGGRGKA